MGIIQQNNNLIFHKDFSTKISKKVLSRKNIFIVLNSDGFKISDLNIFAPDIRYRTIDISANKLYINTVTYFIKWIKKEYSEEYNIVLPSAHLRKQLLGGNPPLSAYDNIAKKLKFEKSSYKETVWNKYNPPSDGIVFIKTFK